MLRMQQWSVERLSNPSQCPVVEYEGVYLLLHSAKLSRAYQSAGEKHKERRIEKQQCILAADP